MSELSEFEQLFPEEKYYKLGPKQFRIGVIPARISLLLWKLTNETQSKINDLMKEEIPEGDEFKLSTRNLEISTLNLIDMATVIAAMGKRDDPTITIDWLMDNISRTQIEEAFAAIFVKSTDTVDNAASENKSDPNGSTRPRQKQSVKSR